MFNNILVATDGSRHAERAVEIASDMAAKYRARLVLLHVVGHGPVPDALVRMATIEHLVEPERPGSPNVANVPGGIAVSERGAESEEQRDRVRWAVAGKILDDAEDEAKSKGVKDVVRMTEQGDAADAILECAQREGADLIVMGTRGLSDLKGLLMGSVSHKVAQRSECTCITVK